MSVQGVLVEQLRLDERNPRQFGRAGKASDTAIIADLYRSADLDELLQSIAANGYMDIEPLIVLGNPGNKKTPLTVLEGNRRLAALRLMREPELVAAIKSEEKLSITVPPIAEGRRPTLDMVSVYCVDSREKARSFIGFKHINGPARWNAYAKAQFAANWYREGRSENINLNKIADAIGDKHETIKRMVSAVYVLEQAKEEGLFDIEDRYTVKFNFSHLYTALCRSQYMKYLGLESGWAAHDPEPNQVPPEKLDALKNVLLWIYGSKRDGLEPVVKSQNPDIKRLGEVLAHGQGRNVLETKRDLDAAHASTEPVDKQLAASLIRARDDIGKAVRSTRGYDGYDQSLLEIAEDVKETAETVHDRMRKKRREANAGVAE